MTPLVVPAEHSQCPEGIPAAGLPHCFVPRDGDCFGIGGIEKPGSVGLPLAFDDAHGILHTLFWPNAGVAEVVESAKNVVVIAGREGELEELRKSVRLSRYSWPRCRASMTPVAIADVGPTACSYSSKPSRTQIVE
jgi:hypothetical protein